MKKRDILFLAILLIGAIWLAFLPNKRYDFVELSPEELIYKTSLNHYFTTDDVAKMMIKKDPLLILVDIRTKPEFEDYALPGAMNIPFDSLLSKTYRRYIDQEVYNVVFYSNGSSLSDQAWFILTRLGYQNLYVMQGGLNLWIETILRPIKPADFAPPHDFDIYNFRLAASKHFGGGISVDNSSSDVATPVIEVQQNNTTSTGGGCD
ncbi:MAG: rhodanese-like domain-containing protein [Bacteroidales bacterium]|nr:rhodanese-like domain-containing protein [Bacteroidales bacterium]